MKQRNLFNWKKNPFGGRDSETCNVGFYELSIAHFGEEWSAKVDSMLLLDNPLSGKQYDSSSKAKLACRNEVLRIERDNLALQRMAKK